MSAEIHLELVVDGLDPIPLVVDPDSKVAAAILAHCPFGGAANQIPGELFAYTTTVDIPFDGTETDRHEVGDVVYWRSQGGGERRGVLFMHGNTEYGDGCQPRSNGPAVRFARVSGLDEIRAIRDGTILELRATQK